MKHSRFLVLGLVVLFANAACYNNYFISKTQLEKLEAKVEQKEAVAVIVDGCDEGKGKSARVWGAKGPQVADAAAGASDASGAKSKKKPAEDGIDPETGCPTVLVNTASPMFVVTQDDQRNRVTPFNFAVTDTQVVSPDYDLLLPMDDVKGGEVQTFSPWKTTFLLTGVTAVAVGLFVGIQVAGGDGRKFGE